MAPKLQKSIKQLIKSSMFIDVKDILITLKVDFEGKKKYFTALGVYLEGIPIQSGRYSSDGGIVKINIPTYGLEHMLNSKRGVFSILSNVTDRK